MLHELSCLPVEPLNLPQPHHPELARLCDQLRQAPATPLTLEQAAATLHTSRASFMRRFRRETGMSFGRWRQQARLLHALTRLAAGQSVLAVALECGYDSPSAFAAMFRRTLGQPPSGYFTQ